MLQHWAGKGDGDNRVKSNDMKFDLVQFENSIESDVEYILQTQEK